jgi:hypothetical protein
MCLVATDAPGFMWIECESHEELPVDLTQDRRPRAVQLLTSLQALLPVACLSSHPIS